MRIEFSYTLEELAEGIGPATAGPTVQQSAWRRRPPAWVQLVMWGLIAASFAFLYATRRRVPRPTQPYDVTVTLMPSVIPAAYAMLFLAVGCGHRVA